MTAPTQPYVSAVVGVFADRKQAQTAFEEMQRAGIALENISLVGSEDDIRHAKQGYYYPPSEMLQGETRAGAIIGGEIGAVTGLLMGIITFLMPGVGLIAALGPLAGMLMGAGLGAVTGGPLGAANYQDDAIAYRKLLEDGSLFVIAHCASAEEEQQAVAVLNKMLPREVHVVPYAG